MTKKIEDFIDALRTKLLAKCGRPALAEDLKDPEALAEIVSHSIGSETQKLTLKVNTHKGKEF